MSYIPRLKEEALLREFLEGGTKYRLCWVRGERGCGKTTFVKSVIEGRDDSVIWTPEKGEDVRSGVLRRSGEYRVIVVDGVSPLSLSGNVTCWRDFMTELRNRNCYVIVISEGDIQVRSFTDMVYLSSRPFLDIKMEKISYEESRILFPRYSFIEGKLLHAVSGGRPWLYGFFDPGFSFRNNMERYWKHRGDIHSYFRKEVEKGFSEYSAVINGCQFFRGDDSAFVFYLWFLYPVMQGEVKYASFDDFWKKNCDEIYSSFLALDSDSLWIRHKNERAIVLHSDCDDTITVCDTDGRGNYQRERLDGLKTRTAFLCSYGFRLRYSLFSWFGFGNIPADGDVETEDLSYRRILTVTGKVSLEKVKNVLPLAGWNYCGDAHPAIPGSLRRGESLFLFRKKEKELVLKFDDGILSYQCYTASGEK